MSNDLRVGDIVESGAGRDRGAFYVVARIEKDSILAVDGLKRTLQRPKMKNRRHVTRVGRVKEQPVLSRMTAGRVKDSEIRAVLMGYNEEGCSSQQLQGLVAYALPRLRRPGD